MRLALVLALVVVACGTAPPPEAPPPPRKRLVPPWPKTAAPAPRPPRAELVESIPSETDLGSDTIVDTHVAWLDLVRGAQREIALGHFYATASADGAGRLAPILEALADAVTRGVRVRVLLDALFADQNVTTLERLRATGAEVRLTSAWKKGGGIQHAKYLVVDRAHLYVGSANFDWRSLEHIHELGIVAHDPALGQALSHVFNRDWEGAKTAPTLDPAVIAGGTSSGPDGALWLTISPGTDLPKAHHELSVVRSILDGASSVLRIQVLDYDAAYRDGRPWTVLQEALVTAAGRGVQVRLLVSDWMDGEELDAAKALAGTDGIDVARITIPEASTGFVPFARVAHAKYVVGDDDDAWVGSSNWKADYFTSGRNVGIHVRGGAIPERLVAIHDRLWARAERLVVDRDYPEKRIR